MGRIVLCQYVHYHFISKSYFILPGTSLYIGIEREIYRFDINGYLAYLLSKLAYLLNKLQEPDLWLQWIHFRRRKSCLPMQAELYIYVRMKMDAKGLRKT